MIVMDDIEFFFQIALVHVDTAVYGVCMCGVCGMHASVDVCFVEYVFGLFMALCMYCCRCPRFINYRHINSPQ
jgi:hypothetical protein